jgi:predicted O-methyltransferase YrrM
MAEIAAVGKPQTLRFRWVAAMAACLAFQGELMAGKRLLPDFGGAAYVWCGVVLFFQLLVVVAYYGSQWLGNARAQNVILIGLGLSGLLTLLPQRAPLSWLPLELQPLAALLPYSGLTTALFCATPLLHQRQADRGDFTIYAWSNAGALAGLVSYPLLVEPLTDLSTQDCVWAVCGLCVCALGLRGANVSAGNPARPSGIGETRWQWWILPGISSATMLATTNQILYEAAGGPLAWAMPLALFLATYVFAFSGNRRATLGILATAGLVALTGTHLLKEARSPVLIWLVLIGGGTSMLACHVWLAASRGTNPHGFYSATAIGGALGSALTLLVIPRVTDGPIEFPILTLSTLTIAGFLWSGRIIRPLLSTCAVVAIGGTLAAEFSGRATEVARARTLYGCWRVTKDPQREFYALINNTTIHGEEDRRHPDFATTYYGKETGLGQLILEKQQSGEGLKIGVVGLGAGTLARYLRPQDALTFYELDPKVEQLARRWFTYLDKRSARVVLGDGRKCLEREEQKLDILILDAFNGDAIPTHLLTQEAGQTYRRLLRPGGALAIHITNAHVDLLPVAEGLARAMSMGCQSYTTGKVQWAILRPGGPAPAGTERLWTDQRSSLLGLLRRWE